MTEFQMGHPHGMRPRRCGCVVSECMDKLLSFSGTSCQQHNSANKRDSTNDGRKREGVFLFGVYLNWPEIDGLFGGGVGEALVTKGNNTDDDEQDANDGLCFHGVYFGVEVKRSS